MAPSHPQKKFAAKLVLLFAAVVWPGSWILAAWIHARQCGVGLNAWLCDESLADFAVHQALVSLSPPLALLLFAVGDDLRRVR